MISYLYQGCSYHYLTVLVRKNFLIDEWEVYSLYTKSWRPLSFDASLNEYAENDIRDYYGWYGKTVKVMSAVTAIYL